MALDSYQQAYIDHPLLPKSVTKIIANSGSGKSTTIASKIGLLLSSDEEPKSVIAITFTNKAAWELRSKIKAASNVQIPYCSTFHGLAILLLKESGVNPVVMNEWQSLLMVRKIMETNNLSTGNKRQDTTLARDLLNKYNYMRTVTYYLDPLSFPLLDHFQNITINLRQFIDIYMEYDQHKKNKNLWDFQDLISPRSEKAITVKPDTKYAFIDECICVKSKVTIRIKETEIKETEIKETEIKEIESLLKSANVEIDTPDGWVTVTKYIPKGIKETLKITMEDGRELICTPDHKIETSNRGWVEAQHLTEDDDIITKD